MGPGQPGHPGGGQPRARGRDIPAAYRPVACRTPISSGPRRSTTEPSRTTGPAQLRITIEDTTTIKLATLQVKVFLRGAQMADPDMSSALQLLRRAANLLARQEDAIVFRGQRGRWQQVAKPPQARAPTLSTPCRHAKSSAASRETGSSTARAAQAARTRRAGRTPGEHRVHAVGDLEARPPVRAVRGRARSGLFPRGADAQRLSGVAPGSDHPVPRRRPALALVDTSAQRAAWSWHSAERRSISSSPRTCRSISCR